MHKHTYTDIYIYIYTHMFMCMYIYIYIYINTGRLIAEGPANLNMFNLLNCGPDLDQHQCRGRSWPPHAHLVKPLRWQAQEAENPPSDPVDQHPLAPP